MRYLKQSTAVDVPVGPFLDSTDGVTAETALTITQPDVRLKKNAAAWGQKAAAQTLSHEENGNYEVTLDATDTDTLGLLRVHIAESGALPVWDDFMVMPANVWDALFGADKLQVDAVELLGTAFATPTVAGVPEVDATHWRGTAIPAEHTAGYPIVTVKDGAGTGEINTNAGKVVGVELVDTLTTYTSNTPQTGDSFARIGAAGAGLTSIDAAISTRATPAQVATELGTYDAPTNAEMEARTLTAASYGTAANQSTIAGYIDTEVAAVLAAVDTEVAAIKLKTDNLPSDPADQSAVEAAILAAWTTALTESYNTDGSAPTPAQALFGILQRLTEFSITGTSLTVKKLDGSTTALVLTLDDATSPSSSTRSS